MNNPAIQNLIRNNLSIPTLPEVVMRVTQMMQDPDSGAAEVGAVVSEDAPIAAKVLRIANSSFYGLRGECMSTEHACTVVGMRVLKNIVTQAAVISCFEHVEDTETFRVQDLWGHASMTGHLCSKLAEKANNIGMVEPTELYVCGLLHDVGKVVLLDGLKKRYLRLVQRAHDQGVPQHKVERDILGFDHTDVGVLVCTRWDLPEQITRAIQYHHGPRRVVAVDPVVSIVAHANLLAHAILDNEEGVEDVEAIFDEETRSLIGLTRADLDGIVSWGMNMRHVEV